MNMIELFGAILHVNKYSRSAIADKLRCNVGNL